MQSIGEAPPNTLSFHRLRWWLYAFLRKKFRFRQNSSSPDFHKIIELFLQKPAEPASQPVDMNEEFSVLFEFLERCGPEVEGRGLTVLETQQAAKIERFISGSCDETERRELARFLQLHPAWIRWVADRIKMAREVEAGAPLTE